MPSQNANHTNLHVCTYDVIEALAHWHHASLIENPTDPDSRTARTLRYLAGSQQGNITAMRAAAASFWEAVDHATRDSAG
jgi:hypothetical protein